MDLIDIFRIFHPKAGVFFKINHILEHKASLNQYKKIEITPCILSDYNGINSRKKSQRVFKHMETEQYTAE
jgi:hypothetical protein